MRKENPVRYSSMVGEAWMHIMFKVKYCHNIFDINEVREECNKLFDEAAERYGLIISGKGAHEAEVSYLRTLGFKEQEVQFADQMRFFRNGMLYYGTIIDKEYAKKVILFTKKKYKKLKELIQVK